MSLFGEILAAPFTVVEVVTGTVAEILEDL